MPSPALSPEAAARLRAELQALPSVRRALLDGDPAEIFLVCEQEEEAPAEALARSVLARHGVPAEIPVHLAYVSRAEPRRRVRFVGAAVADQRGGRARAQVELEWNYTVFSGVAEGEGGPAQELRLVAAATLRALEAILGGRLTFELRGIKGQRAFDADVVVALLRSAQVGGKALLGAALATDDVHRSAALAVLNATNRVLGNYLAQV